MKKRLTMKHIFIPVAIVVIILMIVAAVLSNGNKGNTAYETFTDAEGQVYHMHGDEIHYGEH